MEPIFKFDNYKKDSNNEGYDLENDDILDESQNKGIKLKAIVIGIVIAMICVGSIGGYTVYNTTSMKFDTSEMAGQLNTMKDNLEQLSDTVSANQFVLTEMDMEDASYEQYNGGVVAMLDSIDTSIDTTKADISDLLSLIAEDKVYSKAEYEEIINRYNDICSSMSSLNEDMDTTINDIAININELEKSGDINNSELLSSLKVVKGELTTVNNNFEKNMQQQLSILSGDIDNLDRRLSSLSQENDKQYETITNNQSDINDLLSDNQKNLTTQIDVNNTNMNETISSNQATLILGLNNQTDTLNSMIAQNGDDLGLLVDTKYELLSELVKNECAKVFQHVTKEKYEIASALVRKYDLVSSDWEIDGDNVSSIILDAINSGATNEEIYASVADKISFDDIRKGIVDIPLSITISTSYNPGSITYRYHHHTDEAGDRRAVESIMGLDCPGGCFTTGVHNHSDACIGIRPCPLTATKTDSGEEFTSGHNYWWAHYECPAGHGTSNTASSYGDLDEPSTQTCGYMTTYYKCGGVPYNEWKAGCGFTENQIMSAEIVWEESETGIND